MKNYIIDVWYRYSINGEMEKEFERFDIMADDIIEANKWVLRYFNTTGNAIPFKLEIIEL